MPCVSLMTERQVWLMMAKMWDKPEKHVECMWGICNMISRLANKLSDRIFSSMYQKVRDEQNRKKRRGDYLWTLKTKVGSKARARFCRKQAELLKRKTPKCAKSGKSSG